MHYSQLKKQSSNRKGRAHPGTPRPNVQNCHAAVAGTEDFPSGSSIRDAAVLAAQERLAFNFRPQEGSNLQQQRNSGLLPRHVALAGIQPVTISGCPSSEHLPNYLIWVKNEPFDFGILSPLPCPKIGINILRKIAEYCRDKPGHFPELSLNQWSHICKYKMQLATDLSLTYFRVFDVLTRHSSTWTQHFQPEQQNKNDNSKESLMSDLSLVEGESWDAKFNRAIKQGQDVNEEFKVDTMQFLLFLYIQHFLRLHKKYFVKSYGDEPWPKAWVSNLMQRSSGAGTGANVPEQQQAEFLMANLPDIVDFLMLLQHDVEKSPEEGRSSRAKEEKSDNNGNKSGDDQLQCQRVTREVIKSLSLILGMACTTPNTEFKTLDECLQLSDIRWKLEYSRYSRTVDRRSFIKWIMKNLKINPWGPSSVPIPQVPVSALTGVWEDVNCFKQNKFFWNTQSFPKSWYLISGVNKQMLVMDAFDPMSSIKVHRCTNSFLYLPGVYNYILVQKCHGIKLNLGVASKVVKFVDCSDITVSAVGRQFLICDVARSTFHLLTPSSPIICGSKNHEITLAPYNTTYPKLPTHMKLAGVSVKIQRWLRPLEISNDGFPRAFQQSNISPLSSEQFKMFPFPFKSDRSTISSDSPTRYNFPLPGTLPTVYLRRVDYPAEKFEEAKREFAGKLMLSEDDTTLIYQITLQRFKKWLKEAGHWDHIVGLRSYQKSLELERSEPILCSKGHDLTCVTKALKNFFNGNQTEYTEVVVRSNSSLSSSSRTRHLKQRSKTRHEENPSAASGCMMNEFDRPIQTKPLRGAGDETKSYNDDEVLSQKGQGSFLKLTSKLSSYRFKDSRENN